MTSSVLDLALRTRDHAQAVVRRLQPCRSYDWRTLHAVRMACPNCGAVRDVSHPEHPVKPCCWGKAGR